jgi:hypothetical protein
LRTGRWGRASPAPRFRSAPLLRLRGRRVAIGDVDRSGGGRPAWQWEPLGTVHSVLPSSTKAGGGQGLVDGIWLHRETGAAQSPCGSVENFVLRHWRAHGWVGFHCENRLFLTLYAVLFFDIIHASPPTPPPGQDQKQAGLCFTSTHQDQPHDLCSRHFASGWRASAVQQRLAALRAGSASAILRDNWKKHYGTQVCSDPVTDVFIGHCRSGCLKHNSLDCRRDSCTGIGAKYCIWHTNLVFQIQEARCRPWPQVVPRCRVRV